MRRTPLWRGIVRSGGSSFVTELQCGDDEIQLESMKGTNYLSAMMSDEWSSGDDVNVNGDKSSMEQQPIGEPPDISGGLKYGSMT